MESVCFHCSSVVSDAAGVYVCMGVAVFTLPVPDAEGVHIKQVCVCAWDLRGSSP